MTDRNRTPLILGIIAGVLAVAVVITLVIYLTRPRTDASQPAPSAPASAPEDTAPSGSDQPSESEAPTGEPAELELSATGFTLVDAAGTELFAYGWRDDAQQAVTELSEAFGAAPGTRTEAGNGTNYPDYTVYAWEGFSLYDMVPIDGGATRDEYSQPSYLRVAANTVGDIAITAEFDVEIGMPVDDVRSATPDREAERGSGIRFVFGADRSSVSGGIPSYSMIVDTNGDAVTAILYFYYSG